MQPTRRPPRPARDDTPEAQLAESVQAVCHVTKLRFWRARRKAENAAKAAAEAHHRVVAALAKAERDREVISVWQRAGFGGE